MKKTTTFIIQSEKDFAPLLAHLKDTFTEGTLEVIVRMASHSRSVQQNRLMWLWNTEIGNHLGLMKDEIHELLKRKFAVPIFSRDDVSYGEMVNTVKRMRKEGFENAEALAREITRLTTTTDFTVEQMAEYLKDVEHYAAEVGASLTFPEDLYYEEEEVEK